MDPAAPGGAAHFPVQSFLEGGPMKRRSFLTMTGAAAGTYAAGMRIGFGKDNTATKPSEGSALPRRIIGKTDIKASVVGFPGLALVHQNQEKCSKGIIDAFKRGVNYFDVAPAYGNGDAEVKLGVGLQALKRDRYYLACKTKMRDAKGARQELERSLKRLKTDYFDVYQMHCLRTPEEVKQALGPGGAIETLKKAKKEGKVRYFGFSAHTTRGALTALEGFPFDTVMFPINFVEYFYMGFGKEVLEKAKKSGAGVLAIKPMCGGAWPKGVKRTRRWWYRPLEKQEEVDLAVRFTLSREGVAVGFPPGFLDLLDKAVKVQDHCTPLTKEQVSTVEKMASERLSIFEREEKKVACAEPFLRPVFPDSPHECCSSAFV